MGQLNCEFRMSQKFCLFILFNLFVHSQSNLNI